MLSRSRLCALVLVTVGFATVSVNAGAKDYVLEDWDGPAPTKNWYSNPSLDTKGWAPSLSDPLTFATWTGATWWAPRGLYATAKFALFAGPGTGEWQWQAPGSATVYRAEYGPVITKTVGCVNEGMRTAAGAWQPSVNSTPGWTPRTSAHPTACTPGAWVPWTPSGQVFIGALGRQVFCSAPSCGRLGSPTGNRAVFGVQRTRAVQPQFDAYLPGARLYLTDYDKPTIIAGTNTLAGWVNSGNGTATATATDAGLGVKSLTITGPTPLSGSVATKTSTLSCTGDRNDRCPASWNTTTPNATGSLTYDVATLPEGINLFSATASDIVDNTSTPNTTAIPPVKVDRTGPTDISATGPLVDDEDRYFNGTDPQAVTVTATDPNAPNSQPLSGIKTIRIETGGTTLVTQTITCSLAMDRCPATANQGLAVPMSSLAEGTHELVPVVVDQAGNAARGNPITVYVDRTPPATPTNLETDFDPDETRSSATWDASDPDLSDGRAGSGVASYRVRYEYNGVTKDTTRDTPDLDLEGVPVGATVTFSITAVDKVGLAGTALQAAAIVAALPACVDNPPVSDPVRVGLLPGTQTTPVDMFVLGDPIAPATLLARLPAGAQLVSLLERSPNPADEHTSGTIVAPGDTTTAALNDWKMSAQQDMSQELAELQAARDDLPDPAYRSQIDKQIAQVTRRQAQHQAADGVPVRAFAVAHDDAVTAAIEQSFGPQITRGASIVPDADCGPSASTPAARPAARAAAASARSGNPTEVTDYSANSYSPPFVRVRTQSLSDRHTVTVAWKYVSVSNLRYWKSKYRRSGTARGTEIQVNMDRENDDQAFGNPWWYRSWRDPGPAPFRDNEKNPQWSANFRCAYPDDYFSDNPDEIGLTVGMGCRPNQIYKRYRWWHVISEGENNDQINVSAQPVHYAKDDHAGANLPGGLAVSESTYCEFRYKLPGSCYFGDHGPGARNYKLQASDFATTPSNVVFRRRPLN